MPTLTTLIDSTVPVAADFNGNYSALNGVCGTGTAISTYVAGDTLYASGVNTLAKLAIGSTGQVLTVSAGIPAWAASTNPVPIYAFHEDFQGPLDTIAVGAPAAYRLSSGIFYVAKSAAGAGFTANIDARGLFRFTGDAANTPTLFGPYDSIALTTPKLPVKAADSPTLTFRVGVVAGLNTTRRVGAADAAMTADPGNGIFIRAAAAGNYFAVCRAAAVETTLDTGVTSAVGMHVFKLVITTALVTVYVDDVSKGTIATNIPAVGLSLACSHSSNVNTDSTDLDYINVTFTR